MSSVRLHFKAYPALPHSPGSGIMIDETEVKRWRESLTATAASVIAAISLMRPDNVRVVV